MSLILISLFSNAQAVQDETESQTTTTLSPQQLNKPQTNKISNEYNITIDEQGNASIIDRFTLDSDTWNKRETSGTFDPKQTKQKIIKSVPRLYITSIDYLKNPANYTDEFHIKGIGAAQIDEDGKWKTYIGEVPPNTMNLGGKVFNFRIPIFINNDTIWQIQNIKLPKTAKDVKIEKDSFNNSWISYSLKANWKKNVMLILGVLFVLIGIICLYNRKTS